jgi:hypothetical protein
MSGRRGAIALAWPERATWNEVGAARARRLIDVLCDAALPAWCTAALAAAADPETVGARVALDRVLLSRDRVQLWRLEDDLATATWRLGSDAAHLLFSMAAERAEVREATRRAVLALACADGLSSRHRERLTCAFLELT